MTDITLLQKRILSLVSTYKLTLDEIAGYLVEQNDIVEKEKEIIRIINFLIEEKKLLVEKGDNYDELLLRPSDTDVTKWCSLSRDKSFDWINKNTKMHSFYMKSRNFIYNNLIKKLKQNSHDPYYQVYNRTSHPMEYSHNEKKGVMFASNDYLGLSCHPRVIKACQLAAEKYGNGSCGSRLTVGTTDFHLYVEKKIATFKNTESAAVFSSGYLTNLTFFSCFGPEISVFYDSLCHACIIDGINLSGVNAIRFKHNNMKDLEEKLNKHKHIRNKLIIVESVYSLDGDIANMTSIIQLAKFYQAKVAVDEAHSSGTLGKTGHGIKEYFNLASDNIDFTIGTLGKAFGAEGGYLCANDSMINACKYGSRPYLFTTARAFPVIAGACEAISIIEEQPERVQRLQANALFVRNTFKENAIDIGESNTHIIPIMTYDTDKAHQLQNALEENGIFTALVTYPGVPPKKDRVRINISAMHTQQHLKKLVDIIIHYSRILHLPNKVTA